LWLMNLFINAYPSYFMMLFYEAGGFKTTSGNSGYSIGGVTS